jgi:hypothetical protein
MTDALLNMQDELTELTSSSLLLKEKDSQLVELKAKVAQLLVKIRDL